MITVLIFLRYTFSAKKEVNDAIPLIITSQLFLEQV